MKRLLLVLAAMLLSGCIPVRNEYSPSVSGTISLDRSVVVGASVCVKSSEIEEPACVQSDANGRFRLLPVKQFEMATVADHYTWYELTIETKDGTVLGFTDDFSVGMVESVELACNLKLPVRKGCAVEYCEPRNTESGAEEEAWLLFLRAPDKSRAVFVHVEN